MNNVFTKLSATINNKNEICHNKMLANKSKLKPFNPLH